MSINARQSRLIEQSVNNHVKYYDKILSDLLKHRVECLLLNSILSQDLIQNNESEAELSSKISESTKLRFHKFQIENAKLELTVANQVDKLLTLAKIESDMKPDILAEMKAELKTIIDQNDHLKEKLSRINTIEKPLMDQISNLISSFEQNIDKSKARLMHPSIIKNLEKVKTEEEKEKELSQVDYRSFVLNKKLLKEELSILPGFNVDKFAKEIEENMQNSKIFDQLGDDNILYKLSKSTMFNTSETLSIDNYEDLISKTIEDIEVLNNENEKTILSWNSNADLIMGFKQILEESKSSDEVDVIMES
ncbi:uncharacterized protein KGF55_005796 [Candida pseudojiufengensis]|uniref:uncharacterized protein n=1 Tax=Candida pseudojiufengensis TaxID=497109 RepID=UPI0022253A71|nr:uncharacterized protein KGF55_005796 [Candida pseudojiufengensis]KAI5958453.1 hypothetical protein KGF55_005796 [Candida pseudojiufengensis]